MNIALIGASGFVGSKILAEALARGHRVSALVRHPDKLPARPGLSASAVDALDAAALAEAVRGHDAVVSAYSGMHGADPRALHQASTRALQQALRTAGLRRLLMVGGAGSLYVAPGVQLVDSPDFPAEWKAGALGARDALAMIQADGELDWSFVSPPALLAPGQRTGQFRLGGDTLLMTPEGPASISVEDLAVAILDELEQPLHIRRRFTVGY